MPMPIAGPAHAGPPSPALPQPADPAPPHNFADLLHATVVGDPTNAQLADVEHDLRRLHQTPEGAAVLRQLRLVLERHGRYPVLVFGTDDANGRPIIRPDERPDRDADAAYLPLVQQLACLHAGLAGAPDTDEAILPVAVAFFATRRKLPVRQRLAETLQHWTGAGNPGLARRWAAIETEAGRHGGIIAIAAFNQFLIHLADTYLYRHPPARARVADWLARIAHGKYAAMRAEIFAACIDDAASCRTKALHVWHRLSVLTLKHEVRGGRYKRCVADLCDIARATFRMRELDSVVQAKVSALRMQAALQRKDPATVDDVAVALAYQSALCHALKLRVDVPDPPIPARGPVTREEIEEAWAAILRAEATGFATWLVVEFEPFIEEIGRQIGTAARGRIDAVLDAWACDFDGAITERLRSEGIPDDEEARQQIGARLSTEMLYAVWRPHANVVLEQAGLPALPAAPWAAPVPAIAPLPPRAPPADIPPDPAHGPREAGGTAARFWRALAHGVSAARRIGSGR